MLSEEESQELQTLMTATTDFESLADVIETDIVALGRKAARFSGQTGEETRQMLLELYESTLTALSTRSRRCATTISRRRNRW